MIHFLKSTFRIFRRNAGYTLINIAGLSIGLSAGILILLYVFNELSYDRFHENGPDIYRVNMVFVNPDGDFPSYTIPAAVGPSLAEAFPAIKSVTRITQASDGYFLSNDKLFEIKDICYADSTFFDNFSFSLIQGDPASALNGLYKIVLTESVANAIFGNEPPIGKVLRYNGSDQYVVTGIAEDPPPNSSIRFKALLSFSSLYHDKSLSMGWNGGNQYITFLHVQKDFNPDDFSDQLKPFLEEKINRDIRNSGGQYEIALEPLSDINLHPYYNDGTGGNLGNIRIFSAIALLIIIIACFNFTSLSTAKAMRRSRETGIRKVSGASRAMLIRQFLGEAILMSFVSLAFALLIIELVQPWYNAVTGLSLSISNSGSFSLVVTVFLLVFFTGILAGAYPAFYLASFNPVKVLKGGSGSIKARNLIPKILVIIQFAISAVLINCALIIFAQLDYIRNFDPGFRSSDILAVYLSGDESAENHQLLGNELLSLPGLKSWTAVSEPPGVGLTSNGYLPEGYKDVVLINVIDTDSGFISTLDLKLMAGRNFVAGSVADSQSVMVNETYAKRFGFVDPAGHFVVRDGKHPIIGVVKDFNFSSLHSSVEPLILTMKPWDKYSYLLLHIDTRQAGVIKQQIESRWHTLYPDQPYVSASLSTLIAENYSDEQRFANLFSGFTLLAMVVACLGLFGLSAIMLQQRRKELGIRRILGASSWSLLVRETLGFTFLVLTANVIAALPVWFIMNKWLANFSYTISISLTTFLFTAFFTILIAWLTILWQSWQTARLNPAEVIRYE